MTAHDRDYPLNIRAHEGRLIVGALNAEAYDYVTRGHHDSAAVIYDFAARIADAIGDEQLADYQRGLAVEQRRMAKE